MICGRERVAYYLANQLSDLGMHIKIIEKNRERCEELCELLPKATIINGDATEHDLLIEEGIQKTDAFIALTGMDEENIIMSLFARKQNVSKVIVKINEDRRAMMIDELGLDSIVEQSLRQQIRSLDMCGQEEILRAVPMWKRCTSCWMEG